MLKQVQAFLLCLVIAMAEPTVHISSEEVVVATPPGKAVKILSEHEVTPTVTPKDRSLVTTAEVAMSEEDIELIALITMAEAEGECEEGKRLVIDTILNRVDSEIAYFPDNVHDVIYQKNAFTSVWNGRMDRCHVDESICQLVREELISRTNSEVMYFTAGKYGAYGEPLFVVGHHYFSGV